MASVPTASRIYQNIQSADNSRMHLGDVYNNHRSPDERALKAILDSLSYPGMTDRRDALAEAHEKTFDWTFLDGWTEFLVERDERGDEKWDCYETVDMNFRSWLQQEDQGLFYVTGKPGSGKSTFMYVHEEDPLYTLGKLTISVHRKTLATNSEVTTMLQAWAADAVLLRSDHFFWLLGEPMQKSVQGLLRCMLHSVLLGLSQYDMPKNIGAIRHICGPRWQSTTANGAWSSRELKHMLTRLSGVSKVKSFFLIDALDEYEPQDHLGDLANEIWWLSQLPNVKLCVSCRPWDVFTRKFESSVSLRLDQLTCRDMETYVGARLIAAEEESGWASEFRDETHAAKLLIQSVARSAEGVFLWTELVVAAMCSEIRKGTKAERLSQMMSDFPSDLDEYFHRLIFNRIGRSRRNVEDTAAALKLAIVVHASSKRCDPDFPRSHPFENSYMNFWLLRNGDLKPGFSWMDNKCISQPSVQLVLDQTAIYLEETCKDLLVLNRSTAEVGFLHRTVFDFLSDNKMHDTLEQTAPSHFSGKDFVFDLAKLRCLCLLRIGRNSCASLIWVVKDILSKYEHLSHVDQDASWFSNIGNVTISQMRDNRYWEYWEPSTYCIPSLLGSCVEAGLGRFLLELYGHLPALALVAERRDIEILGKYLDVTNRVDARKADLSLLQYILEIGCNPNAFVEGWELFYPSNFHGAPEELDNLKSKGCRNTAWTAWLRETFIRFAQTNSIPRPNRMPSWRKRQAAAISALLLRNGADPHCMVCVARHTGGHEEKCRLIALDQLMEAILPADRLTMLRNLRELCSNQAMSNALKRNQRRRVVRSFQISEQFFECLAKDTDASELQNPPREFEMLPKTPRALAKSVLEDMANVRHSVCNQCLSKDSELLVAIRCLDCEDQSILCYYCSKLNHFEQPTLGCPYGDCAGDGSTAIGNHTRVTFVGDVYFEMKCNDHVLKDGLAFLSSGYPLDQAISIMKEWYSKDPIDPDLSFEDVVRSTRAASPLQPDQTPASGRVTGEVSKERSGKSKRAWSSPKRFVRRD